MQKIDELPEAAVGMCLAMLHQMHPCALLIVEKPRCCARIELRHTTDESIIRCSLLNAGPSWTQEQFCLMSAAHLLSPNLLHRHLSDSKHLRDTF